MHWLSKAACGVSGVLPGGGWGDLVTAQLELVPDALLSLSSESQISETCHHITGRYMAAYGLQFQKLPGSEICRPHHIATGL